MNSQDTRPPPETSGPIAISCEVYNLDEAQDKNVKIAIMSMFMDFKEDMNESFKETKS